MKKIITAISGICLAHAAYGQQARDKEFTFSGGLSWSNVSGENVKNDPYADSRGTIFPFFNVGYTWNFSKHIGFTTGVGYSHFRNITSYNGYFRGPSMTKDMFGDDYYPLTAADYSVTRTINSLDVPLCVRLGTDYSERLTVFVDVGFRLNFLTGDKNVRNGSVSYKALYPHPDYNNLFLLVEDNPAYGYTTLHYHNGKIEGGNKFGYGVMMNIGARAAITDDTFLAVSFTAFRGLSDMSVIQHEFYVNPLLQKTALLPSKLALFGMSVTYGLRIY